VPSKDNQAVIRRLIGTWRWLSFNVETADGQVTYPFGREAAGYYIFAESGYASVAITPSTPKEMSWVEAAKRKSRPPKVTSHIADNMKFKPTNSSSTRKSISSPTGSVLTKSAIMN
jgi:hypothetical protein